MTERGSLPAETAVGRVALRVADLDRQVEFYEDVVGLETIDRSDGSASLGVDGSTMLELDGRPDLDPRDPDETGLFHTAILSPNRGALGDALARVEEHWRLTGASDHLVSEALYLDDPEGNGVELYRDRPESEWTIHDDGRIEMDTLPLDRHPIREAAHGADRAHPQTTVGHVHLEVADAVAAWDFYVDGVGLGLKTTYGERAVFMAAGEYHHHVGANTWNGRTEPGTGHGLAWFELVVPNEAAVAAARERLAAAGAAPRERDVGVAVGDPDGIELRIRPRA
jgi:catechol 2,3-dioxygenase